MQGRYSVSDVYFINHATGPLKLTPEKWMRPDPKSMKDILNMWQGTGMHNQIQALLGGRDYKESKAEFVYKGIVVVGKADFMPPEKPDDVWEFKTSEKLMTTSKPWHDHQVKMYTTMFKKKRGLIYQPVQNAEGLYLRHLKTVERDDVWFEKELEGLYQFHLEVEKLWKKQ